MALSASWYDITEGRTAFHCCRRNNVRCSGVASRVYVGLLVPLEQKTCSCRWNQMPASWVVVTGVWRRGLILHLYFYGHF